jgi:hypothetical protein
MKVTEIIRGIIDLIDQAETNSEAEPVAVVSVEPNDEGELVRMRQIAGLLGGLSDQTEYSNTPQEAYADIDAVLASGDDVHKSKNPADIRADSISMYPNHQHKPGE